MCYKSVDEIKCKKCGLENSVKNGKSRNGEQRYICKGCKYSFQIKFRYQSYLVTDFQIILLTKEGCGINSTSRILDISPATVLRRIQQISKTIKRPYPILKGKTYEVDEMFTYLIHKDNRICIAYSFECDSGNIIDFVIGRRKR